MQAIELEATIDAKRGIHAVLPDNVPPGKARMILLYDVPKPQPQPQERIFGLFRDKGHVPDNFNDALPENFWTGEKR